MWITAKELAEKDGVTVAAIKDRIRRGKLKSKSDGKKVYVEVNDETAQTAPTTEQSIDEANAARARKWDAETDFKQQKILNLRADLILKQQKVLAYREKLRVEFCEGTLECFTDAFADLKAVLVDCKLKKEQIKKFKDCYAKCLKKFEQKLVAFLKKKDDEEEEESKEEK